MTRTLLLAIALVYAAGCAAQTVSIRQLESAQAGALPRTMAVMDVVGVNEQAQVAQTTLVSQLRQSGFYTLIDEGELQRVARAPLRLENQELNMPAVRAAAQQLGIDALLQTALQIKGASGTQFGSVTVRIGDPQLAAKLKYRLIDARTGEMLEQDVISSEIYDGELNAQASGSSGESRVLMGLTRQAASRLAQELAPHTSDREVQLAGKALGRGVGAIRRGNKAAQVGNWEKAAEHWNDAIQDDSRNHAAWYNLGVAFEALHRYESASQAFQRALRIHKRSLYDEGLERCARSAAEYHLAMAQRTHPPGWPADSQLAQRPTYASLGSQPLREPGQTQGSWFPPGMTKWPISRLPLPQPETAGQPAHSSRDSGFNPAAL